MSRIGKKPIQIPDKVEVKIDGGFVNVKGPLGELKLELAEGVSVEQDQNTLVVKPKDENIKEYRSLWGTFRQLIENMLIGVTKGWKKQLEVNGVGYRTELKGDELVLNVGYSHPVNFKIPEGVKVSLEKNVITIEGIDKQLVGEVAASIRKVRKPEPYKGKGIKYVDEIIRRKAGKQAKGVGAGVG